MGCEYSKKKKTVEPVFTCKIATNIMDDFSKGIYLGKLTNHHLYLAENCIDGDKKNKQLEELRRTKGKIVACGFLHDGSAVLADEIRKILLLLQKDKDACNFMILKDVPVGIAVLGIDIFVTLSDKRVQHATVVNDKIVHQSTYKTNSPCLGIASFNGDVAVGFKNGEVHILDRKFQKHGHFVLPKFEDGRMLSPTSMMQFKQTLLITDCFAHAVVRVTLKGEPLFVYTGMTSPRCTVVDNSGNIILAGYDDLTGEKMQHLSPRGEKIPSRMSITDVSQFPYCIAFYRKYSKLLIAGESDKCETCIIQVMETSTVQAEPETSHLVDATTDTVSEGMSLLDIDTMLIAGTEKPPDKTAEKTTSEVGDVDNAEKVPDAEEEKQSNADASKLILEDLEKPPKIEEKDKENDKKNTVVAVARRSSTAEVESPLTPVDVTLPNEVPDNTAVTVYDKTNKGVVKKVLITVREKKPKAGADNGPITVYENTHNGGIVKEKEKVKANAENGPMIANDKTSNGDVETEKEQIKAIGNHTGEGDKTSNPGSRPLSPIHA